MVSDIRVARGTVFTIPHITRQDSVVRALYQCSGYSTNVVGIIDDDRFGAMCSEQDISAATTAQIIQGFPLTGIDISYRWNISKYCLFCLVVKNHVVLSRKAVTIAPQVELGQETRIDADAWTLALEQSQCFG
jgi:hypothetical protein